MATEFIVILFIQTILFLAGCSTWIIGKPIHDVLKHPKRFRHYCSWICMIYRIAPQKASARLGLSFILSSLPFVMMHNIQTVQTATFIAFSQTWFYVMYGGVVVIGGFVSLVFLFKKNKDKSQYSWAYLREKAHFEIYKAYDKYAYL